MGIALSCPAHADTPDPAPTLSTDAATHATVVTGPHHLHKVALNLNVTDWWLAGSVIDGVAGDLQLIVDAHMVTWALLEKATDATGAPLKVTPLKREPSPAFPKKVLERVAITLPRALADKARRDGLTVTVSGTKVVAGATRAFPITVPAQAMAAFLDGYAKAASTAEPPAARTGSGPRSGASADCSARNAARARAAARSALARHAPRDSVATAARHEPAASVASGTGSPRPEPDAAEASPQAGHPRRVAAARARDSVPTDAADGVAPRRRHADADARRSGR